MRRTTTPFRTAVAVAALAVGLAACGGDDGSADAGADAEPTTAGATDSDPDAAASGAAEVVASFFAFEPEALTVAQGTTVTFVNEDDVRHTATSGAPGDPDGRFDIDLPEDGSTGDFTFEDTGTFAYHCEVHARMVAEIVVE